MGLISKQQNLIQGTFSSSDRRRNVTHEICHLMSEQFSSSSQSSQNFTKKINITLHFSGYRCSKLNCSDPDKCELQECSKNATCSEDGDPHECSCNTGFSGDGLVCDNINECDDGSHNCSIYATCIDNIGSYSCYCNQGFSGDGLVCDNINDVHKISDLFEKTEVTTFATSVAFRDYELSTLSGDGLVSDNVNKCNDDSHNCSTYATCTDNEGPYSCQCKEWFSGDGRSYIFEGCPAGNYATNSNTCEKCPINTYNNIRNNFLRECIPCPNYYTTENQGSTSRTECKSKYCLIRQCQIFDCWNFEKKTKKPSTTASNGMLIHTCIIHSESEV